MRIHYSSFVMPAIFQFIDGLESGEVALGLLWGF